MMIWCMVTARECQLYTRKDSLQLLPAYVKVAGSASPGWGLEMEPASYGKAKPHAVHLTVMHKLACLFPAINDYKVSTGVKHSAKPSRCSRVHLYRILYSPKCRGDPHCAKYEMKWCLDTQPKYLALSLRTQDRYIVARQSPRSTAGGLYSAVCLGMFQGITSCNGRLHDVD